MAITIEPVQSGLRVDQDGVVRMGASRVTLDLVLAAHERGETPEGIVELYPTVQLADVYAAIAFYLMNRAEVDEYLRQRAESAARLKAEAEVRWPPQGRREELLRRQREQGGR